MLGVGHRQARGYRVAWNSSARSAFAERLAHFHSEQARLASTLPRYFKPSQHARPPPLATRSLRVLAASKNRVGCPSRQLAGSKPVVVCGRLHESRKWLLASAALRHTSLMNSNASVLVLREVSRSARTMRSLFAQASVARQGQSAPWLLTPNPSIEGTLSGLRPPSAPHVKR